MTAGRSSPFSETKQAAGKRMSKSYVGGGKARRKPERSRVSRVQVPGI